MTDHIENCCWSKLRLKLVSKKQIRDLTLVVVETLKLALNRKLGSGSGSGSGSGFGWLSSNLRQSFERAVVGCVCSIEKTIIVLQDLGHYSVQSPTP